MEKKEESQKKSKRPSALKRDMQSEKKRLINKSFRSEMRTAIRSFDEALAAKDSKAIETAFNRVQSSLDKGVKKGVFKANMASRSKARIQAKKVLATTA